MGVYGSDLGRGGKVMWKRAMGADRDLKFGGDKVGGRRLTGCGGEGATRREAAESWARHGKPVRRLGGSGGGA